MSKVRWLLFLPPLVFAGFAGLAFVGMQRGDPNALPSTFVGQDAPAITEEALPGFPPITPELVAAGEVTLVNFWASWCPPCRAEHPRLLEMAGDGIPILGVNFKDQSNSAITYLREDDNPFRAVAFDPRGRTAIDWGVTAPPETFILGADGEVLFRFQGPLVGSDYEQRFLPALEEAMGSSAGS